MLESEANVWVQYFITYYAVTKNKTDFLMWSFFIQCFCVQNKTKKQQEG